MRCSGSEQRSNGGSPRTRRGEAYGAAGSLALFLLWIDYSSTTLFFGAEFTQAWAVHRGRGIAPEQGARRLAEV